MITDFELLKLLLNATDKESLTKVCIDAFNFKENSSRQSDKDVLILASKTLSTEDNISSKILLSVQCLEKYAVSESLFESQEIEKLFPSDFQNNLKKFLSNLITKNVQVWKEKSIGNSVFAPKLVDFDWRVDIVASSNNQSQLSVPTCLLNMKIQEAAAQTVNDDDDEPAIRNLNVEMARDNLDAMIKELTKIKDQLTGLSSKSE